MLPVASQAALPPGFTPGVGRAVSIIVVNYNGREYLEECLGALTSQSFRDCELLVVDCASSDDSISLIRTQFPAVRLIASPENLGYSGAVNLGFSYAGGRYIAVLNMDAIVEHGWLEPMVDFLDANPAVGAVTSKILLYDDPTRINALGQNVHITALGFNRALNRPDGPPSAPEKVSGLHGAAFLIRHDLLARMGGMNAMNFLYHEDVDLSWLVRLMGYDIYCVPASVVRHKYALTMSPRKLFYLERNRMAMLLSNLHWLTLLLLFPLFLLTECMMLAYCMLRGPTFLKAKTQAVLWLWQQRAYLAGRRRQVRALRGRPEWEVITGLRLNYDWDQLLHLGRERRVADRGASRI